MGDYRRPPIDAHVFLDGQGQAITYGNRWTAGPPDDTYSVETHPERFAPLHTVADALIDYLCGTFDVVVEDSEAVAADLMHPPYNDVVRAVRIRPNDPSCATLTFVLTAYPAVYLHAGLLNDFPYPVCGCDACDSTWAAEADDLERQVFAVVAGQYRESVERRQSRPWVSYALTCSNGKSSGGGTVADGIPLERVRAATPILRTLPDGWAAWPRAESLTIGPQP
ncbi:DUF6226 family protein [Salinibacterium sp. PAMC 21357]|uniref:DUF6226 family protein n=1 Tax=Salinibacterium sp. PAMC 21357 TaxID=1112215 RepID=UPI000287D51E|nr:DUF6226 family protein [Salinibacterium sp. PAMC 21357]